MPFRNVDRVWAIFLAYGDRRISEMVQLMHPNVVWAHPGPTDYHGHEGVRRMLTDLRQALGDYSLHLYDISELEPGVVVATGQVTPAGPHPAHYATWTVHLADDHVSRVELTVS